MSKARELLNIAGEQRGQGQGVGGPRQGDGGADICKCPKCGETVPHDRGEPCTSIKCPKCGTAMVGEDEDVEETKITKGMRNVLGKLPQSSYRCRKCGTSIPKYAGRYPAKCPECGTPLAIMSKSEELLDLCK